MKRLWLSGALLVAAAGLSACGNGGGGSGSDTTVVTPPTGPAPLSDRFGPGFGGIFRVNANSDPRPVTAADLDPVNPAAEPLLLQ